MLVSKIGWMPMLVRGGGVKGGRAVDGWRQNGQAQQERAGLVEGSMKFNRESNLGVMLSTESRQSQARLMLWGWNGRRNFNPYSSTSAFGFDSARVGRIVRAFGASNKTVLKNDDCAYEQKLQLFKRNMLSDLDYEYDLFLQDMRQFFLRDGIDLYNLTFLKNFLRNSMKRDADIQVSSIIFFRKERRHLSFVTEEEYFEEIQKHVNEFYDQRYHQISKTFADLCLHYDKAAKVIFDNLAKEDHELYQLLHDNQYFVKLIGSKLLDRAKDYESHISRAIAILKEQQNNLIEFDDDIRERAHDLEWILYMANLIRAYDRIYEELGLEEEDVRLLAHKQFKLDYFEKTELDLLQKVKAKYIAPRPV